MSEVRSMPRLVDITGASPELSEFFRCFVETVRGAGARVIDRNNLTLLEEPGDALTKPPGARVTPGG